MTDFNETLLGVSVSAGKYLKSFFYVYCQNQDMDRAEFHILQGKLELPTLNTRVKMKVPTETNYLVFRAF